VSSGADSAARFRAVDGLRLVGALAVMMTHVGFDSGDALRGPFAGLLGRLDSGVAIFFAVSGFVLFRPHVMAHLGGRPRPRVGSYFARRAARILPVLWLAVGAAYLVVPTKGAVTGDYLATAALVHIYVGTPLLTGLTQFWSLATEVAFYLLLPAAAALLCRGRSGMTWLRRASVALLVLVPVGPVWMAVVTATGHPQARLWLPGFVGWFAVGMLLALWNGARTVGLVAPGVLDSLSRAPGTSWAAAVALLAIAGTPVAGPLDLSEPTPGQAAVKAVLYTLIGLFILLPTVTTIAPATEPTAVRALGGRLGSRLGEVSYGLFAYHVIVLAVVDRLPGFGSFQGRFVERLGLTFVATLVVATVSYVVVERPLMAWVRGATSRTPATATAVHTPS